MKKKKKILLAMAAGLVILMAAAYAVMAIYFSRHFYSGTTINGADCTERTAEEAKQILADQVRAYTLTLQMRDGVTDTLDDEQLGMTFEDDGKVDELLKEQNSWFWIGKVFAEKTHGLEVAVKVDDAAVSAAVDGLSAMQEGNYTPPVDASIVDTDTGYAISPEVEGNQLNPEAVKAAVREAALAGEDTLNLDEHGCYQKPAVYQDDAALNERLNRKNQLVSASLTMDFGSGRTETVDASLLKTWVIQDEAGNDVIDQGKITEYVASLAAKYDTYHTTRYFEKTGGGTATLTLGDYGWLMDQATTAANLSAAIEEGQQGAFEVTYENSARSRALNDIGSSYVEISISRQTMWCYVNGELVVKTPVVTGNVSKGTDTPSPGVWKVKSRITDYTMKGKVDPATGEPSYTAHCNYWIPYTEDLTIGLHDLVTRSAYGGDIYLTNGSHGCVNTPLDAVKQIFDVVSYGFPVIVY